MKKLVFDYEMKLTFSSPVTDHRFQLRCVPATGPRQQVVDVEVAIEPDVELETTIDSFDSVVMTGFIPQPHTIFSYSVKGIAFVDNAHIKSEDLQAAVPVQLGADDSRAVHRGHDRGVPGAHRRAAG